MSIGDNLKKENKKFISKIILNNAEIVTDESGLGSQNLVFTPKTSTGFGEVTLETAEKLDDIIVYNDKEVSDT